MDEPSQPQTALLLTADAALAARIACVVSDGRGLAVTTADSLDALQAPIAPTDVILVDEALLPPLFVAASALPQHPPAIVLQREASESRSLDWIRAGAADACPVDQLDAPWLRRSILHAIARCGARPSQRIPAPQSGAQKELAAALESALQNGELQVHYQPQVDIADRRVVGMEALLRWEHPDFGTLLPEFFVPAAEDCGLIVPIGAWLMREACGQLAAWNSTTAGHLRVAVNMSPVQLRPGHESFKAQVAKTLAESGVDPGRLEFELTESSGILDAPEALAQMDALAELGVGLAIDDFGHGYTSIAYLRQLQLTSIKIDRSFVRGLPWNTRDFMLVESLIHLAHSFGLQIVAEGVETREQLATLRGFGCRFIQGYFFSPPLNAVEATAMLHKAETFDW